MTQIPPEPEALLVLIRHGAIVRPANTSNFDGAPLSSDGWRQMDRLAKEWPFEKPVAVWSSNLVRSVQSATVLQTAFHVPLEKRECIREWTADPADLAQEVYMGLEHRSWREPDWVPPSGESLVMAGDRITTCLDGIASRHHGAIVAVVGHGIVFSLFVSRLRGIAPTFEYKASIPNAGFAVAAHGDAWRLVSDFRALP